MNTLVLAYHFLSHERCCRVFDPIFVFQPDREQFQCFIHSIRFWACGVLGGLTCDMSDHERLRKLSSKFYAQDDTQKPAVKILESQTSL